MRRQTFFTIRMQAVFWLCFWIQTAKSAISEDGLCSLYTFVHFTDNGTAITGDNASPNSSAGFTQMAAAFLAMEHFNARDTSVVNELANFTACNIQFDVNRSIVFDTTSGGHTASQSFFDQGTRSCAIAGPYHERPALELSVMATAAKIPLVANGGFNFRISEEHYPYSSTVFPDMYSAASFTLGDFLLQKGRTDFINLLYDLSDRGIQRREALALAFDVARIRSEYHPYSTKAEKAEDSDGARDVMSVMKRMKRNGFRTIVVAMGNPFLDIPILADAAEALAMNNGDYFWVWFGNFAYTFLFSDNANITKLIAGSVWLLPLERAFGSPDSDPFLRSWKSQGSDFVDRVNAMNPIQKFEPGYVFAEPDFFQIEEPEYGAGFLYDAVMAIGMGACLAQDSSNGTIEGAAHVNGIRSTNFVGASGHVVIDSDPDSPHARLGSTVAWAALNLFPGADEVIEVTDIYGESYGWKELAPFVYADGRTVPPDLLRTMPNQYYLNDGLRTIGLTLMSVALSCAFMATVWVYMHRRHPVVRAAQPHFLYLIAFGSAVTASTIIPLSFDESYGWSDQQLSYACMAIPWLFSMGHIITYGTLFSKLWRVDMVLQFSRRKISESRVVWPSVVLLLAAIVVLSVWTGFGHNKWEREEINVITGESIGECTSDYYWAFMAPLIVILVIVTLMAAFMAWKTKDVDHAFSESKWIFMLIIVQLEVLLVAIPVMVILQDTSTNGQYIGFVMLLWIFPTSTLGLVTLPKVVAFRKSVSGNNGRHSPKRGEAHGVVRVSGLPTSNEENHLKSQNVVDSLLTTYTSVGRDSGSTFVIQELVD